MYSLSLFQGEVHSFAYGLTLTRGVTTFPTSRCQYVVTPLVGVRLTSLPSSQKRRTPKNDTMTRSPCTSFLLDIYYKEYKSVDRMSQPVEHRALARRSPLASDMG